MVDIILTGRGVSITEAIRNNVADKLSKLNYIDKATKISVEISESVSHRGADQDFSVRVLCFFPKAAIRLKKDGRDIYVLIDEMLEPLQKMINRYMDNLQQRPDEVVSTIEVVEDSEYDASPAFVTPYTPKVRRKVIEDMTPISVAEAIDKMELLGRTCYLFKNLADGKLNVMSKEGEEYILLVPSN